MAWLKNGIYITKKIMSKVNMLVAFLCGLFVFGYMLLTTTNIAGRYLLNLPINGTMEIGQIVLATVIFFNLAYAQMEGAHIRVTAVLERLPNAWRQKVETGILAVGFLMMALMAWRALPFAIESFHLKEAHMSVDVPIWPTKFIFFIGWSMLGIQFLIEFLDRTVLKSHHNENANLIKR